MKILELIKSSKILKTSFVLIIMLIVVSFAVTWILYGDHPVDKKTIGQFAEIIVPFGEYEELYVVDGPAGIFLTKEEKGGTLKLINADGSVVADLAPATDFVQQRGDLLELHYMNDNPDIWMGQWRLFYPVVNYKQLMAGKLLPETEVRSTIISEEGGYYYWVEGNESETRRREIRTSEGETIYECKDGEGLQLMTADGLFRTGDKILNMYTGETSDTKGHEIIDGNGHLWICQGKNPLRQDERYVVGAAFEELEEDFTGEDLTFSKDGKYLFGQMCVPSADGKRVESVSFVADALGNIIYTEKPRHYFQYGAEGDIEFVDIKDDKLLRRHYLANDKTRCDYIDLLTMERKDFGGEPVFSAMDFDDDIVLCAEPIEGNEGFNGEYLNRYVFDYIYGIKDSHYFLEYDWYFTDADGQVYDFAFEGAYPSKDGYAAVRSEKKWGVIKFYDAV